MTISPGYSRAQIGLHWAIFLLIALQYLASDAMQSAFRARVEAGGGGLTAGALLHIAGGTLIFLLTLWRLSLRRRHGVPPPPAGEPQWAHVASRVVHWAFYALLLAMPLAGIAAWATGNRAIGELHETGWTLLALLILVHAGAVMMHQFVWRTHLFNRMTRAER